MSTPRAASVSSQELRRRCEWVARRNARYLRETSQVAADFYFGKGEGDLLYRLQLNMIADWMNDGELKKLLFSIIRRLVEDAGYDTVIFASDSWGFEGNERYCALSDQAAQKLTNRGFQKLQELGYGTAFECLCITGQTPVTSAIIRMRYLRDATGRVAEFLAMEDLPAGIMAGGRAKMWGEWKEPGMAEAYERAAILIPEFKKRGLDLPAATTMVNIATEAP